MRSHEENMARADRAWQQVRAELDKAMRKFAPFNSDHEGYAVILEELDELWTDVKGNHPAHAQLEVKQVAAMAIRYMVDLGPDSAQENVLKMDGGEK